jgi:hypothetical protein
MDECPGQVRVQEEPDYFFSGACLYAHMSTRKTLTLIPCPTAGCGICCIITIMIIIIIKTYHKSKSHSHLP